MIGAIVGIAFILGLVVLAIWADSGPNDPGGSARGDGGNGLGA